MPELPEVESVRQGLESQVLGRQIRGVTVLWDRIIESPAVNQFKKQLEGQVIEQIGRRGKFLLFYLTDYTMISHLRMEGKYFLKDETEPLDKHTHVIFDLEDGLQLRYNDVRKFGRMTLVEKGLEASHKSLLKLGPEPTEKDLKTEDMAQYLINKTRAIKTILLDQKMVVGVGNIYADEILFDAKINPKRPGQSLTMPEINTLRQSIISIIDKAIYYGGSTIRTYHNMLGEDGSYQNYHQVYGKPDQPCPNCGRPIVKIQLNGRGTHYCPHCQKEG